MRSIKHGSIYGTPTKQKISRILLCITRDTSIKGVTICSMEDEGSIYGKSPYGASRIWVCYVENIKNLTVHYNGHLNQS